jgi:hypothetical protein
MAVASVTTNIVIKGQDDASAAINKASASAKGLTGSLQAVQSRAQGLTGSLRSMVSGDVLGGLSNLKGSLGGGPGLAGQAALAAAGIAGVGVALGAAAYKTTQWSIEIERLRAQMNFAFAGGADEAFAFADAIGGVGVESVVKLQTTLKASGVTAKVTVEQLQAITNAATAMGKTGDDALSAFADAVRSGSADALKQVGVFVNGEVAIKQYAESLGLSAERLSAAQRSQAVLNATLNQVPGLAQAGTDTYAQQDKALSNLSNAWEKLKLKISELVAGPALSIVKSLTEIVDGFRNLERVGTVAIEALKSPLKGLQSGFERAARAALLLKRGDFAEAAIAGAEAVAKIGTLGLAQALDEAGGAFYRFDERARKSATALETTGEATSGLAYAFNEMSRAAQEGTKWAKEAGEAAAKAAAKRATAARAAAAEAKRLRDLVNTQGADFMTGLTADQEADQQRKIELQRQETDAIKARAAAFAEFQDRVMGVHQELATDPAVAAQIEQTRIQLDLQRQIAEVSERYAMDEQLRQQAVAAVTIEANAKIAESAKRLAEVEAAAAAKRTDQAFGVAAAVVQGLGMIEGAERAQAGVQALIETARSIQSFAMYDFAAGAQHALAAVAFAKAALTAPPATGAGVATSRQIQEPAQRAQSAGTTNIVLNGVYATKAQVGAALGAALGAAKPTGMLPA